ncbi:MAG: cytochrome P450 [Gammaproteobacteria bacterium]|nr:cytochrome P450 [Gammaproteobacteria bacterium]
MSSSNIFEGADLRTFFKDPYGPYAFARQARVFRNDGVWYAARYEDVDWILKDRRFGKQPPAGSEHRMPQRRPDPAEERNILNTDPPDHTRLRGLVAKAFNAHRVAGMRPVVQSLVDGLLDDIAPRGSMDIMRDYAYPIPATVISDMLGIPDADRDRFGHLSNEIIRWGTGIEPGVDLETRAARAREAREAFDDYLTALFPAKREAPTDDLTTDLLRAESEEGRLTEHEVTKNVRLLFQAGHETTVNLIGNALVALYRNPEELAKLRADPGLMPTAVEEFLRFDSSVQQLPRVVQERVEVGGQTLEPGEMIICLLGAANHDPDVYDRADDLDLERTFVRSKSFGGGIHFCLGAQLARMETEVALGTLLERLPEMELTNLDDLDYAFNPFFRGPKELLATW